MELKAPAVGESITEVEIGEWLKAEGDPVRKDESLAVIETDKATVDLPAPADGKMGKIIKAKGETASVGELIAYLETDGTPAPATPPPTAPPAAAPAPSAPKPAEKPAPTTDAAAPDPAGSPPKPAPAAAPKPNSAAKPETKPLSPPPSQTPAPVVRPPPAQPPAPPPQPPVEAPVTAAATPSPAPAPPETISPSPAFASNRREEVVRMSRLRRTVAERLVQAQRQAALLTTFNEIDLSQLIGLRKEYGEAFRERHGVKLGFMSFFIKAVVRALQESPALNAEIRGDNLVYRHYYDIGVAVGGGKGLVVPVIRNAELLGFAQLEKTVAALAAKAREGKLTLEELEGGTFTITNGGVYGSLMSTPVVNPPQSGVLGMHAVQERPVAEKGAVVIRPMMYVALTYDHRVVDGREAVAFLRRVKEIIETPARLLLEV